MQNLEKPKVGIGVIVIQDGSVLLGKRKNSHSERLWAPPGGHLEFGETVEACALRELKEETSLEAVSLQLGPWVENLIDQKHYITLFAFVPRFEGTLQNLEPHKCEEWQWFPWNQLPTPLFPSLQALSEKRDPAILLLRLLAFYRDRDWEQFHSPKNIVMDLAAEMGELVDPFRWLTEEQSYRLDAKTQTQVADEIADLYKALLYLCHKLGIDAVDSTFRKIEKMGNKYPASLCKGKALKYTEYVP